MRTLYDTSILISHLRGDARATDVLLSVPTEDRLVSVLSRVEIEGGMRSGERREVASIFGALTLVDVSDLIARRAASHLRRFRRSHASIDLVDYVVAATAELHDAALATLNIKHFPMFSGLRPPW
ncbi:MAG: type II toxin-antitoxin system VapC family toxin [Actinomycetota bacterium]